MSKKYPELNDKSMLKKLDDARRLYEDGAIVEAAIKAQSFADRIRSFEDQYDEAVRNGGDADA